MGCWYECPLNVLLDLQALKAKGPVKDCGYRDGAVLVSLPPAIMPPTQALDAMA